jgi:(2Fe-2S) ferredoxin
MRANAAGCLDQCERGVTVVVYPEQVWYGGVKPEDVPEIVESHLILPDRPGWGTEPNEAAIRAHPPKAQQAGLLDLGREN